MLTKNDLKQLSDIFLPRFDQIDKRLDKIETRLDALETRVTKLEFLFFEFAEKTEERFYDLEQKLNNKFDSLKQNMNTRFEETSTKIEDLKENLKDTDKRLDKIVTWVGHLDQKHDELNKEFKKSFAI